MPTARPTRPAGASSDRTARWATAAFVVGLAGLPVWWVLGLAAVFPILVAVPLALDLRRRTRVRLPPGAGWWLLFLVWVALGVFVLWATAPGAEPGGGSSRLLVFGYRFAWYAACTVVLLWVGNTSTRRLPDRLVHGLVAWVFVVTVAGGLLGMAAPDLAVPTLAEQLLPRGLVANSFVDGLVSAEVADVQSVLGDPQPRPKAPFPFTNTWGSVVALSLVFFVAALVRAPRRARLPGGVILALAILPVAFSLNRALWVALAAGCVGLVVLVAARRGPAMLVTLAGGLVLAGVLLSQSPLGELYTARLENPHSNDRRGQLLEATVQSVTSGSPVVGFGSTRDVQGSFASIAGGATPDCPACGVPPLGTQGHLWLVLFSQGWPGLAFFLVFVVLALARNVRCRTINQTVATFVLGFFLLQLPVYDTLGMPLMIAMVAIALAWREGSPPVDDGVPAGGRSLRRPTRAEATTVCVAAVLGAAGGALTVGLTPPTETATVAVALTPTPIYLDLGTPVSEQGGIIARLGDPPASTVDTEAALLRSEAALERAGGRLGMPVRQLRRNLHLAAPPLTSVIELTVSTAPGADAAEAASAVTRSYLLERRRLLARLRSDLVVRLQRELEAVNPRDPAQQALHLQLIGAVDHLRSHRPGVGRVIRRGPTQTVPPPAAVPVTSGLALGVLAGGTALGLRRKVIQR